MYFKSFLIIVALFATACSGSVQKSANTGVDAKVKVVAEQDTALIDSMPEASSSGSTAPIATEATASIATAPPAAATPPQQPQYAPRQARQVARPANAMPGFIPNTTMGAPYMTQPAMVYGGPTNQMVNYGVAVLDASTSDCRGSCARIYISADTMPPIVGKANGVALIVDGFAIPMSYFGQRTPIVHGDLLMADGSTASRQISVVPLKKWSESIRWHLPDAGEHMAKLCFYFKGAGNYHHLMDCVSWTMSIDRSNYPIQYGIWGK